MRKFTKQVVLLLGIGLVVTGFLMKYFNTRLYGDFDTSRHNYPPGVLNGNGVIFIGVLLLGLLIYYSLEKQD